MPGWIGHNINISITTDIKTNISLAPPCDSLSAEINNDLSLLVSKAHSSQGSIVGELASESRMLQINTLSGFGSNKTGNLASSITIENNGNSAMVGTDLYYASYVEEGRGSITATGKALHFYLDGAEVFVKSVGPASPRPFVATSYGLLESRADAIVDRYMSSLL